MSLISDLFRSQLRASQHDNDRGALLKIVELLAHLGQPNEIKSISKATAALGKAWTRLDSSVGFRLRGDNGTGTALTFRRYVANQDTAATLETNLSGSNNDLAFTAKTKGLVGNDITITYVDPVGNNAALSVGVVGAAITVNLATDGSSAPTSTAAQIKAAIEANADANALVSVAHKSGNDGTGVAVALSATNLTNGADAGVPTIAVASGSQLDLPCVANANEWEVRRSDSTNTPVTLRAFLHNVI